MDGEIDIRLPPLVEWDSVPDDRPEIPSPETAERHPHLLPPANEIHQLTPSSDSLLIKHFHDRSAHRGRRITEGAVVELVNAWYLPLHVTVSLVVNFEVKCESKDCQICPWMVQLLSLRSRLWLRCVWAVDRFHTSYQTRCCSELEMDCPLHAHVNHWIKPGLWDQHQLTRTVQQRSLQRCYLHESQCSFCAVCKLLFRTIVWKTVKQAQHLTETFWKRRKGEYLSTKSTKWTNNLKEGDVVLLKDAQRTNGPWDFCENSAKAATERFTKWKWGLRKMDCKVFLRPVSEAVMLLSETEWYFQRHVTLWMLYLCCFDIVMI